MKSKDLVRGSGKFCQRGSNFDNVLFLVDEGREDPKYHYERVIIGPPAKRHSNGVSQACR